MRLFRSKKALAAIVAGSFMFTFAVSSQVSAAPVRVASIPSADVGDGVCDFAANDLGHGSASDPFLVGTASDLAEMQDCDERSMSITGVEVGDGTITYTTDGVHGAFGVGQSVSITSVDPADFNLAYVRVTEATDTTFTIESDVTGIYASGGTVTSDQDFFQLTADIDLSVGDEDWNDTSEAAITGVSANGTTVTYTVDSSAGIEAGDSVIIKGHSVNDYNLGDVTVDTVPDGTTITVSSSVNVTVGTGGVIVRPGWRDFDLNDIELDGQGYTISGLTIDDSSSQVGLFEEVNRSAFKNLNLTGVDIDNTGLGTTGDEVGALAGRMKGSSVDAVTVQGDIIGTSYYVGMLIGYSENGNYQSISTEGTISFAALAVAGNTDGDRRPTDVGGVVGYEGYGSYVDIDADVDIDAFTVSPDGTYTVYGENTGGIMGENRYTGMRNVVASGDIVGGAFTGGAVGQDQCCSYTLNGLATGSVSGYSNSGWRLYGVGGFYGYEDCCSTRDKVVATGAVYAETTEDGTAWGMSAIGGLMGAYGCCGSILNSSATGSVTAVQNGTGQVSEVGGLLGAHYCCGDVINSFATGDVTVTSTADSSYVEEIGGFVGEWSCCGTLRSSYSTGDVSVTVDAANSSYADSVGGFAGANYCCGAMDGTYSTGDVTVNNGRNVGGHTGFSDYADQFIDSYATGNVTVGFGGVSGDFNAGVGGFIGRTVSAQELNRVSATGDVELTTLDGSSDPATSVGGLIGYNSTQWRGDSNILIRDSYYRGSVSGPSYVGGLIGRTTDTVSLQLKNVYVASSVSASEADAVVDPVFTGPWTDASGTSFFDSTVAGTTKTVSGFNARTTAQMKTEANYTAKGWAFSGDTNPWRIAAGTNEGYPYLVPVVMPGQGGGTDWTKVKTLSYAGSKVALTKAKKRALRQAATALIADGCTKVQLRSRPNLNNYDVAAARVKRAHTFLAGVFENRGSDLSIVSNIRVRPNSSNKNTVQVFCGTD